MIPETSDTLSPFAIALQQLQNKSLSLIPIIPGEKRPGQYARGNWYGMNEWQQYAKRLPTTNELEIWRTWPDASVGLCTGSVSGIVAVDFDNRPDLHEVILKLIPDSPCKKQGAKGHTAFYRWQGETNFKESLEGETVVELLSDGRQTLLPPSVHPSGVIYEWLTGNVLTVELQALPVLPADFLQRVQQAIGSRDYAEKHFGERTQYHGVTTLDDITRALGHICPDCDYETWWKVGAAIHSVAAGMDGFNIWNEWSSKGAKYGKEIETIQKWRSFHRVTQINISTLFYHAARYGYRNGHNGYANGHAQNGAGSNSTGASQNAESSDQQNGSTDEATSPNVEFTTEKPEPPPALCIDENLIANAPGLPGRIADWINETTIYRHPALALGAALTAIGSLKAHRVRTATNLRTNLYVLGLAPSGSGKNIVMDKITDLFDAAGLRHLFGGKPASDSAVLKTLQNGRGRRLLLWDEMGIAIAEMASPKAAAHKASILSLMMELFSKAGSVYFGKEFADHDNKQKRHDLDQPCLSVYGVTTPGRFYDSITSAHVLDGFVARWLIFETGERYPKRRTGLIEDVPAPLIRDCQLIEAMPTNARPKGNIDFNLNIRPRIIPFTPQAQALLDDAHDDFDRRKQAWAKDREGLDALWARAAEHAAKLALIVEDGPEITEHSINWALQVVTGVILQTCRLVQSRLSDTDYHKQLNRVIGILESAGSIGLTRSELVRKTQYLPKHVRADILDTLIEAGRVAVDQQGGGSKPVQHFKINTVQ